MKNFTNNTSHEADYEITKQASTFRENEILDLNVKLKYDSDQRLRVRITDKNNPRYEVPLTINDAPERDGKHTDYYVNVIENPFAIRVYRKSTHKIM